MTIDELAAFSQREYESIRNEMATREELRAAETSILHAIEGVGLQLSTFSSRWSDEFDRLTERVDDIGIQIKVLERGGE